MLGKYKESCFAIPWTAKAATESEFAFRERLTSDIRGEFDKKR